MYDAVQEYVIDFHVVDHPFVPWARSKERIDKAMVKCDINQYTNFQVLTWNINGIRSMQTADNAKSFKELLDSLGADIICLQETKVTRDMLDENIAVVEGYNSYFAFSRTKAGYSGVVTYCKDSATPVCAEEGLTGFFVPSGATDNVGNYSTISVEFTEAERKALDEEGRAVITKHNIWVPDNQLTRAMANPLSLVIINVYCPRVDPDKPERKEYKLRFCHLLEVRAKALIAAGNHVIIVGDLNIAHKAIDTCVDVSEIPEFNSCPSRQWLNSLLLADDRYNLYSHVTHVEGPIPGSEYDPDSYASINAALLRMIGFMGDQIKCMPTMIDAFRCHNKGKKDAYTCWNTKSNARATNYGTRIDYILTCPRTIPLVLDCHILSEVQGSDHCPVKAFFNGKFETYFKSPSLCSKYFPEFAGKQVKITSMFLKLSKEEVLSANKDTAISDGNSSTLDSQVLPKPDASRKRHMTDHFPSCSRTVEPNMDNPTAEPEPNQPKKRNCNPNAIGLWKELFKGPPAPPRCRGHGEPCVERTVTKRGPTFNRKFWACARGVGRPDDSSASCAHFAWK